MVCLMFNHTSLENIIEKTLGDNETFLLNKDCLIAFQDTIKISEPSGE